MSINIPIIQPPSLYWSSFTMLYNDLEESLRYVDPAKEHFDVYSHRFYELLLRAATEFESVCKEKVEELKLSNAKSDRFTINDYYLLNSYCKNKIADATVGFIFPQPIFVKPLQEWNTQPQLDWYKSYNSVKHNRANQFNQANFLNVLKSIGALFIVLEEFKLCPQGNFSILTVNEHNEWIKSHDKWPVILRG